MAETLITLLMLGVIFGLIIGHLNINSKRSINLVQYRKVYDNVSVAVKSKATKLMRAGSKLTLKNNPEQIIAVLSEEISTRETFEGCKYDNLTQLVGQAACNAYNVKGTVLSDGTPISVVANNEATNLLNNLINSGKSITKTAATKLVGAIVVNNNNKTLDSESIIPVYEDGLGSMTVTEATKLLSASTPVITDTQKENNCEAINHVWLNGECQTPSDDVCLAVDKVLSNGECVTPTKELCAAIGLVWAEKKCQKNEYVQKYREVYAALQKAYAKYNDDTSPSYPALGGNSSTSMENMLEKYMTDDMKVVEKYKSELYGEKQNYSKGSKALNGSEIGVSRTGGVRLKNGVMISLGCGHPWFILNTTGNHVYNCTAYIDVNGEDTEPNVLGRDIYYVIFLIDDIYPWPIDSNYSVYLAVSGWNSQKVGEMNKNKATCNLNDSIGYGCAKWFLTNDKYDH